MYMFELWRFNAFASIAMSLAGHIYCSMLSSVESASIYFTVSIGCNIPGFFLENSECYTLA